jgi:hypothetical protein
MEKVNKKISPNYVSAIACRGGSGKEILAKPIFLWSEGETSPLLLDFDFKDFKDFDFTDFQGFKSSGLTASAFNTLSNAPSPFQYSLLPA